MGEIKSTLDLVMEKTKHLSLSQEEKVGQQRDTYEKRLKGILQKYADGLHTIEDFQIQLKAIQETLGVNDVKLLIPHILNHVDPDQDNTLWLDLLDTCMPSLRTPIQEVLANYKQHRENLLQSGTQKYLEQLIKQHQIEGSAVIPNLNRVRGIQQELILAQKKVQDKLNMLTDQ